ncbi:carbohydrate sulfotransferase 10-like [Branchiostoma floridae]|uniref:Carbohydrate sulfotransferase n=1 Tax=Branchiostoma floridae TaxID=7739 RepID=A0A9J7N9E3_BRAFL|nr:carbohydrate sulfotransferase 10-like [Branchiostoma floridae]
MSPPQPLLVKLSGKQNEQDQEQTRRKELVEEYCKNKSSSNMLSRRIPMGNFFVSDRYKVLYCKVGKTGSTTTSALLYNLEFGTNSNEEEYWKHQATAPMKRLTSYTKDEQRLRLNTYRKLVVARNPLERLVSDYLFFFGGKEHFVSNGRQVRDNMKYQDMLETIGWNASTTKLPYDEDYGFFKSKNGTYHLVPFLAFIRAVTDDTDRWQNNEHWALVSDYCPLCQVQFDFIAHTETLATDLNTFFRNVVGVKGKENIFPRAKERQGKKKILDVYREIPLKEIQRIERKYKPDFDVFGYSAEKTILQLLQLTK